MDFLKSQLDRIQHQLKGLNASQRMLTASLVAVMVLTLLYWGRYAGQPEMEPVLGVTFTPEELTRATQQLEARGIEYKVLNNQLHVAPDRKFAVMGVLGFNGGMPKNTANAFDQIIKQLTPWDGQNRQDAIFNHGKELALERAIAEFPNVASAKVFIDPRSERRIGGDVNPTANVTISMRDGARADKQLVNAAANIVVGAQAGLSLAHVKVVVDGKLHPVHVPDAEHAGIGGDSIIDLQLRAETVVTQKLERFLNYIDGVRVSVTMHVNNESKVAEDVTYDPKKVINELQESTTKTREDVGAAAAPGGEAGAVPNTGMSLPATASAGAGGRTSTETTETVKNFIAPSVRKESTRSTAGEATPVGASVRVPRSYFVGVARAMTGDAAGTPDAAAVNKAAEEEMRKIRNDVMVCTGLKNPGDISVETFADLMPMVAAAPAAPTAASSLTVALGGHAKEIALGGLALFSLFMVSMIVKKGTPAVAVALPPPAPKGPPAMLEAGEMLAGEAGEGNPLLDGMELDEDSVKTQQMLTQVSDMVDDNPDAAAALVKRWLNRT